MRLPCHRVSELTRVKLREDVGDCVCVHLVSMLCIYAPRLRILLTGPHGLDWDDRSFANALF